MAAKEVLESLNGRSIVIQISSINLFNEDSDSDWDKENITEVTEVGNVLYSSQEV